MKLWKKIFLCGVTAVFVVAAGVFAACSNDVTASFVTYDGQTLTLSGESGSAIEFPVVEREGYFFKGWYTSEDYSGDAVTEATFEKGVTYYAKWAQGYAINFDLDGGTLTLGKTLYVEQGAVIATAVRDYVPTKGELRFGSWDYNGSKLSDSEKMPANAITLTAKYMAEYTVNVYLQNLDDQSTYTEIPAYDAGYYYVGEEFAPSLTVTGYEFDSLRDDKTELTISEDAEKNVYELYFNRESYFLIYNIVYPDGSREVKNETYLYEQEYVLDNCTTDVEGYRFFGWATKQDADYSDAVIAGTRQTMTDDTIVYAVWNKGYTDLFGGYDYIYLNHDEAGSAVLSRGGVDILGSYNERKEVYVFEGDEISLNAKVNENGTFVYYSNRKGSYYLYSNGYIYTQIIISLTDTDECSYSSNEDDNKFYKSGTYTIDEDGIYCATFTDEVSGEETILYFTIGTVSATNGNTYTVYMLRGDEYNYGAMPMYSAGNYYYPLITLNGFGAALYQTSSSSIWVYYTIKNNVVTLSTTDGTTIGTIKIKPLDNFYVYEIYVSAFDAQFTDGAATLTLDGCSTATYTNGSDQFSGTYTYASSALGGYKITVNTDSDTYIFLVKTDYTFENKSVGYSEYYSYNPSSSSKGSAPYLVLNGDGTATLYELHDSALSVVSTGKVEESQGYGFVYTVTGTVADWAETQATTFTFMLDTTSTSYAVYYLLSSGTDNDSVDYTTVYASESGDGAKLVLTEYFAIYQDAAGNIVSGLFTDYTNYIRVAGGSGYGYFTLSETTFKKLDQAPMDLYRYGAENVKITVDGTKVESDDEDRYHAVYIVTAEDGTTTITEGYYTAKIVESMGMSAYIYTFTSADGNTTFKFTFAVGSTKYYFFYYETTDLITLGSYQAWADTDDQSEDDTITVTDSQDENGNYIIVYTKDGEDYQGTYTSEDYTAFGLYGAVVYTFTLDDGSMPVKFTIIGDYFRICGSANKTYTAEGAQLVLDETTSIAEYTVGEAVEYGRYEYVSSTLDGQTAVFVYISSTSYYYFDLIDLENAFKLRGAEAGSYLIVDNDLVTGYIVLNGYDVAEIHEGSSSEVYTEATYSINGYTVTVAGATSEEDKTIVGELSYYVESETYYYAFIIKNDTIAGTYYNKDDLTVIVLDGVNGATYYGSYGSKEVGTYTIVSDSLFYFTTGDRTGMALFRYEYNASGVGVFYTVGESETYYANDFSSIIFSEGGVVTIDNQYTYLYEKTGDQVCLYRYGGENANKYGFSCTTLTIAANGTSRTISYSATDGEEKTYRYFDGGAIYLTDTEGNELSFTPTGEATFSVSATYTDGSTGQTTSYYVIVGYQSGAVYAILADSRSVFLNNSAKQYAFTYNYEITFDLIEESFAIDEDATICGITAYDYMWYTYISYYGSSYSSYFAGMYGILSIMGEYNEEGEMVYTLSGAFNYLVDEEGNLITLSNGTLSRAGYLYGSYGNLFTAEFTGSDGNLYHMSFFLYQTSSGISTFIVYSLTRATEICMMSDGSVVYSEKLLYTLFSFPKSYDEEGNVVYYQPGEEFYPTLKYKGELICASSYTDLGNNVWRFVSYAYTVNGQYYTYEVQYYDFEYDKNDLTGEISSGAVTLRLETSYTTADSVYKVYVLYNAEDGKIVEVLGFVVDGTTEVATDCTNNSDESFTVTTVNGTYTVSFSTTEGDNESESITVTVTPITSDDGSEQDGGSDGSLN